jgi:hypothetical protein
MLSKFRMAIVLVLVAGLVVSGYVGYRLFTEEPDKEPPVSRVTGSADDGWQLVSYRGVTVELPPEWDRLDMTGCEFPLERWGSRDLGCVDDGGLVFLESSTFDAATGPGVHADPPSDAFPDGSWSGYVIRGDVVVSATDADEAVVRRILQSASVPI